MTTNQQAEFIQSLDGDLTPQQAAQLLEMGLEGDTGEAPEKGGEPDTSANAGDDKQTTDDAGKDESAEGAAAVTAQQDAELNAQNAVILAKDGKHTIGYEKLVEARDGEKAAKQELQLKDQALQAAQEELQRLREEAQQRADAGKSPTRLDNQVAAVDAAIEAGVDVSLFGDFSEEAMAKGVAALVAQQVDQKVTAALAKLDEKLAPLEQQNATTALGQHYQTIYEKHPDADSIAESKELADWIATQPSFVRTTYESVLEKGSTQEVVEFFDSFKQATGLTQVATDTESTAEEVKAAAKAAIAKAEPPVPTSLSDFPGGRIGAGDRQEAMAEMSNGHELLGAMQNMTPEQIDTFLNRRV